MNSSASGQVPDREPVDLKALLADTSRILRRLLGKDIELSVLLGDDLDLIQGDPYQLEQVLINLALNARDAMPTGGKLSIAVVNSQLDDLQARSHSIPAGRYVLVTISDTGVGMTSEVRSHIFEPFFSTKKVGQGSGLGLFMTYGIINHHGGHIEVDSQDGKGSKFAIYLPSFERKESDVVGSSLTSWETLPTGRETVLVSDDDPSMRNAASNTLKILGYQVLQATNGLSALALINSHNGAPIDLLVTDVVMPQLDGVQLARQLRESNPDIKLLLISGFAESVESENVLELGARVLEKPCVPHSPAVKVREILDGGSYLEPVLESGIGLNFGGASPVFC
jgi:CheY-like chemotaxis protein